MQRSHRAALGYTAILALIVGLGIVARWAPGADGWGESARPIAPQVPTGSRAVGARSDETRVAIPTSAQFARDAHGDRRTVTGRVVDHLTGRPLRARVRCESRVADAHPATGAFVLTGPLEGPTLIVSARGYRERIVQIAPDADDVGDVRLKAAASTTVIVVDDTGIPIGGAEVLGRDAHARREFGRVATGPIERRGRLRELARTNDAGEARLAIAEDVSLYARHAIGSSAFTTARATDERVVLTIRTIGDEVVRAVDDRTGSPIAGVPLVIVRRQAGEDHSFDVTTATDGVARVTIPPGDYTVAPEFHASFSWRIANEHSGPFRVVAFTHRAAAEPFELRLVPEPGIVVRATDAATGRAIPDFRAWPEIYRAWAGGGDRSDRSYWSSRDGVLPISASFLADLRGVELRLWASADGYGARSVELTRDAFGEGQVVEIPLHPAAAKSLRVVVSPDDHPYVGWIHARDLSTGRTLFAGEHRPSGVAIEAWDGGDVRVSPDGYRTELAVIPAEVAARTHEWTARIAGLSRLVITSVPRDAPAIYLDAPRGSRVAGVREGDEVHFADAPPGAATVGPLDLVDAARAWRAVPAGHDRPRDDTEVRNVLLREGEELRIPWDPSWRAGIVVRGRVVAEGVDPTTLGVTAEFGDWPAPRGARLVPLDDRGRYELRDLEVEPVAVVVRALPSRSTPASASAGDGADGQRGEDTVTTTSTSSPNTLARGLPGETIRVSCADVVLELPEAWSGRDVVVRWRAPRAVVPMGNRNEVRRFRAVGASIRVTSLPCGVSALRLEADRDRRDVPLALRAGAVHRIAID